MKNITCDFCNTNLTETSNSVDYMIALKNERIPTTPGAVTDINIEPKMHKDFDFCGVDCLVQWSITLINSDYSLAALNEAQEFIQQGFRAAKNPGLVYQQENEPKRVALLVWFHIRTLSSLTIDSSPMVEPTSSLAVPTSDDDVVDAEFSAHTL